MSEAPRCSPASSPSRSASAAFPIAFRVTAAVSNRRCSAGDPSDRRENSLFQNDFLSPTGSSAGSVSLQEVLQD